MLSFVSKVLAIGVLVIGFGTAMTALVPNDYVGSINDSLLDILSAMHSFDWVVPVDTVYDCIQILFRFYLGLSLFILIKWIFDLLHAQQ